MKCTWSLLLTVAMSWVGAQAKTIYCPTCSQSDFETAYYTQSAPGDTIVLPAGSATWGNSSRGNQGVIYIITNVTVIGQGDNTVITLDDTGKTYANGVIACWAAATFAHFKIIGSAVNPVTAFQIESYNNPATGINFTGGFRLTDISFMGGLGGGYFAYVGSGVDSGVIDNCRLTGEIGSAELIFGRGPTNAWQTNNTMGMASNIFIEGCTINNVGYVCDANSNARFVVRNNTMTGSNKIDGHGLASNTPARGFRNMEIYGNHFTDVSPFSAAIEIRGGTSMIFDNTSDNPNGAAGAWFFLTEYGYLGDWNNFGVPISSVSTGNPTTITTSAPHGYSSGWLVQIYCQTGATTPTLQNYYTVTVTGPNTFTIPVNVTAGGSGLSGCVTHRYQTLLDYPITDQIGVGKDPKVAHSEPAYVWNNLKNGAPWTRTIKAVATGAINVYRSQTGNPSSTFTEDQIVQSNRDFFSDAGFDTNTGVSRGTTAQMNALTPGVVGYGFWVTDQGSWNATVPANTSGRLYTWNGSSWTLAYTPYAYPHPLRLPATPTSLLASSMSATQLTLSWNDNAWDETGYRIERNTDGAGFVEINAVGTGVTSYVDTTVSTGGSHVYRVRARNLAGDGAFSNVVTVSVPDFTVQPSPAHQAVAVGANVTYTATANGLPAPTYQWRKDGAAVMGATAATLSLMNVTEADSATYTVTATNALGTVVSAAATLSVGAGSNPAGFDAAGYLARYPDVAAVFGADHYAAWLYYHGYGIYQGEVFDNEFRVGEYLALYPDLAAAFGNDLSAALDHWLSTGRIEGKLGRVPTEFCANGYFARNPDVATAVNNDPLLAWGHYWLYGIYEGRAYDDELRVFEYLAINADLTAAFVNDWRQAALHWMRYGRTEGRLGRLPLTFSVATYLSRNPDVAAVWGTNPTTVFLHFWAYGINEGRTYDDLFRVDDYLALNPDLAAVFGTDHRGAFKHWVRYGQSEGRPGKNP